MEERSVFSQMFKEVLRTELGPKEPYQPYLATWLESGKSVDDLERLLFESHKASSPLAPEFDPGRLQAAVWQPSSNREFDEEELKAAFKGHGVHGNVANAVVKTLPDLNEAVKAHQAEGLPGALVQLNKIDIGKTLERVRKASATEDLLARVPDHTSKPSKPASCHSSPPSLESFYLPSGSASSPSSAKKASTISTT